MVVTTQVMDETGDIVNIDVTDEDVRATILATRENTAALQNLARVIGVGR
jgi:hypothetical protein